jgi:hypothetical protein
MSIMGVELDDLAEASRVEAEARKQASEVERRTLEPVERRLL